MAINVNISSIRFNDQTEITFRPNEVIVIVGPNNSGKSTTLREVSSFVRNNNSGIIVEHVNLNKEGNEDDIKKWLKQNARQREQNGRNLYSLYNQNLYENAAIQTWNKPNQLGALTDSLCKFIAAEGRLKASKSTESINLRKQAISHPLHAILADIELEKKLNEAFSQAFGKTLFLDRWAGKQLQLFVGDKPSAKEYSRKFHNEFDKLPVLDSQGDGMRSFTGTLLESIISNHQIILLDEPEAFLHPPQARLLGRMLAKDKANDLQIFISTHSIDILKGVLDSDSKNLRILRIERDEKINPISELDSKQIQNIWNDTLIRSSQILNGLFHEAVIICEGDADCRFYSAIFDSLYDQSPSLKRPDIMFAHCGGKSKIPTVVESLKKVNVKTIAILDFDILRDKNDIKKLVESFGDNWSRFEPEWTQVKNNLDQKAPPLALNQVKQEISRLLDKETGKYLSDKTATEVKNKLKSVSAWATAKETGKNALSSGKPTKSYNKLASNLENIGVFLVECGELERFVTSIGNHGPKWVNGVLENKDIIKDPELKDARNFIKSILNKSGFKI